MTRMFPICYRQPRKSGGPGQRLSPDNSAFAGLTSNLLTFRVSFPVIHSHLTSVPLPHIDNNIAIAVEARGRAGWDDAGCIVFLDDAGPAARLVEIGTVDDIRVAPAMDRTEIGLPQGPRDDNTCRQIGLGRQCRARHRGEAAADHF